MPGSRTTRSGSTTIALLVALFTLVLNLRGDAVALDNSDSPSLNVQRDELSEIDLTLSAAHTTTSWDERDPTREKFALPLLYLHRQGELTPPTERTLQIQVSGLSAGTEIQIEAISHHVNVTTGERHTVTESFKTPDRPCTADAPCTLQWTLDAAMTLGDLYYLRLTDQVGKTLWENLDRPIFVALDTWEVDLGAYATRIYYATLFPFAKGPRDLENRLTPDRVSDFIEGQFAHIVEETWRTQVEEWALGSPLHRDWDADNTLEVFITAAPFALFDGTGIYTVDGGTDGNPYPQRRIWWLSSATAFLRYDTLANGYKAVFAHEFFHLMQWNILLYAGETSSSGRPFDQWLNVFIEAQAAAAVTVQYPELELRAGHLVTRHSAYGTYADHFLTERLNDSYRNMNEDAENKYDAALYWRFLYEQYNDMAIFRVALAEMRRHYDPDILATMESTMDAALAQLDGPFQTFEESLAAFSRANYALRLDNGRCTTANLAECAGLYYDPDHVYMDPTLDAQLIFDGKRLRESDAKASGAGGDYGAYYNLSTAVSAAPTQAERIDAKTYNGAIPNSYGMDFIEVRLDPEVQGQPLTLVFQAEGASSHFNVQLWRLGPGGIKPRALTPQPETLAASTVLFPATATAVDDNLSPAADRLAVIITRTDAGEAADPVGAYSVTIGSAAQN
jgi:hypothetical protein